MAFKINKKITVTIDDTVIKLRMINAMEQLQLEEFIRSHGTEDSKSLFENIVSLLADLVLELSVIDDETGEELDWCKQDSEARKNIFLSLPVTTTMNIWAEYQRALVPTEEDKKK